MLFSLSLSGVITVIFAFNAATGAKYFVAILVLIVAAGFVVAALADFFMLTKVGTWWHHVACKATVGPLASEDIFKVSVLTVGYFAFISGARNV